MSDIKKNTTDGRHLTASIFRLASIGILLFMVFVQFNDPDAIFWIVIYGGCALTVTLPLLNIDNKILFYISTGMCFFAFYFTFEGALEYTNHYSDESLIQSMSIDKPYIEETREFLGTLISLLLVSLNQQVHSRQNC